MARKKKFRNKFSAAQKMNALDKNGKLKKGFKYMPGGRVVKVKS
ncbi:hypothetical protein [Terasakiella sp. SH-1]|nr:hypothetical protein [Terasakiella sp. SH-1]